jgi:Rieske Fe-S protein
MTGGLLAGYGTLAFMAGQFLYPSKLRQLTWVYVTDLDRLKPGEVLRYETPAGQAVTITRRDDNGSADDFLALSSTCPHLGCKVHWEPQNHRFFCPCHNGVFDSSGKATAGPPAEAGQSLPQYSLRVENGMLFLEVPAEPLG